MAENAPDEYSLYISSASATSDIDALLLAMDFGELLGLRAE